MRPIALRLKGLTKYREPVTLDLARMPPGLIAVTGPNGAGKTTLLDALASAPLYLDLSTRPGALARWCSGRDAQIDLTLAYAGKVYRVVVNIDAEARAGAGAVDVTLFEDGVAIAGPGVRDFEAARDRIFPRREVFMASAFGTQNKSGNFLRMSVDARKRLFADLLGLGAIAKLSERAGKARGPLDAAAKALDAEGKRLDEDRERARLMAASIAEAVGVLAAAEAETHRAGLAVHEARQRAASTRAVLDQLEAARTTALRRAAEIQAEQAAAWAERDEANRLAKEGGALIEREADIRVRAGELFAAAAEREGLAREWRLAEDRVRAAGSALAAGRAEVARAEADLAREKAAREAAAAAVERLAVVQARLAEIPGAHEKTAAAAAQLAEASATLQRDLAAAGREVVESEAALLIAKTAVVAANGGAELLGGVPCGGAVMVPAKLTRVGLTGCDAVEVDCGTCQFLVAAREAAGRLPDLQERERLADARFQKARKARLAIDGREAGIAVLRAQAEAALVLSRESSQLEAEAARLEGRAAAGVAAAEGEVAAALRAAEGRRSLPALEAEGLAAGIARDALLARGAAAKATVERLAGADKALEALEAARARAPLLAAQAAAAMARAEKLMDAGLELVVPAAPAEQRAACDAAAATLEVGEATFRRRATEERVAREDLAHRRGRVAEIGDLVQRTTDLAERRQVVALRRSGFVLLEQACGQDGIQALEIDSAGPEVSSLCNELLEACFGARFSVKLRTLQEAERGLRQKEVFDLAVYDGSHSGVLTHEGLSGGEQVLVDEALKLALAIFNARRHGAMFETLYRDEADGALDEASAVQFPAMLRRAMDLGGFRNVIFVTHRSNVADQADGHIHVREGRLDSDF